MWRFVLVNVNMVIVAPVFYLIIPRGWALNNGSPFPSGGHTDIMFYILLIIASITPFYIPFWERMVVRGVLNGKIAYPFLDQPVTILFSCRSVLIGAVFVYGLIVRFAGGSFLQQLAFYPIGIIGAILYWPTKSKYARLLKRLEAP